MAQTHVEMPLLMTPEQVAKTTGLSVSTLKNQRVKREGLPFVKFGRAVRYRAADVIAHINSNTTQPLRLTS